MQHIRQAIWGHIVKHTVEKSQTNAINVTMLLLVQAILGNIWKRTVEKSQTNATNATMPLLVQTFWETIWKRTVEKSQTNATNVTLRPLGQAIWGNIWKGTVKKSQTNLRLATCCRKEGGTGRLFCWVLLVFVGSRQEQYMLDFLHCALSNCLPGKIHNQTGCTSLNCFSNVTCCRVVAGRLLGLATSSASACSASAVQSTHPHRLLFKHQLRAATIFLWFDKKRNRSHCHLLKHQLVLLNQKI